MSIRAGAIIVLAIVSLCASAQNPPIGPQPAVRRFNLKEVRIEGVTSYPQSSLLRAAGLEIGGQYSEQELTAGANRLGSSGVFSQVAFEFWGEPGGVIASFKLAENPQEVQVRFENFVWWQHQELLAALQQKLPLFTGRLPLAGEMAQQVSNALGALLSEKNLPAEAAFDLKEEGGAPVAMYRAAGAPVLIKEVAFAGPSAMHGAALRVAIEPLLKREYHKSSTHLSLTRIAHQVYRSSGRLAVKVLEPEVELLEHGPPASIRLNVKIDEGPQYRIGGFEWKGNSVVLTSALLEFVKVESGAVANVTSVENRLLRSKRLFGRLGYVLTRFTVTPTLLEDNYALLTIEVDEGPQFRMGKLRVVGFDPATDARLQAQFPLKEGQIYDQGVLDTWYAGKLPQTARWGHIKQEVFNEEDNTVDVTIFFKRID